MKQSLSGRSRGPLLQHIATIFSLLLMCSGTSDNVLAQSHPQRPTLDAHKQRVLILTDIGAEVDDTESMVRLLLYSDVIDIQGLIATTSTWKRTSVSPDLIQQVIRAYAKAHGNLIQHDPNYPPAETFLALVKRGRSEYGMSGVGPGKDSEGSNWIISSDQDDSGPWIRKNFPKLFYIVTPGGNYGAATWTGINSFVAGIDNTTISNKWIAEHIQQGHGPLGAVYPDVAYGMEGDTPSWLALIPNGLSDPEHPERGGWGGRYELYQPDVPIADPHTYIGGVPIEAETRPIWTNAIDDYAPPVSGEYGRAERTGDKSFRDFKVTIWRWRDDFQNDFAARMDWATKSYKDANHPPVPVLDVAEKFTVRSGEEFELSGHATDPDGDSLSFLWFQYVEAGSCKKPIPFTGAANMARVVLVAPKVDQPQTANFILRVTDKGSPPLSRYKRVIVTIAP